MGEMKGSALAEERNCRFTMLSSTATLERFSDALLGTCCKVLHQAAHSLLKAAIGCIGPTDLRHYAVSVLGQSP